VVSAKAGEIANKLANNPGKIAIYGWHRLNGMPIQPVSTVHGGALKTPRNRFTELISTEGDLSSWVLLSAGLIAAGHAGLLRPVVTASHKAGVYLLGIATLYAA